MIKSGNYVIVSPMEAFEIRSKAEAGEWVSRDKFASSCDDWILELLDDTCKCLGEFIGTYGGFFIFENSILYTNNKATVDLDEVRNYSDNNPELNYLNELKRLTK